MSFITISKFRFVLALLFCILTWKTCHYFSYVRSAENTPNSSLHKLNREHIAKPVLLSVYYEALCSDSRNFILKQLLPTYDKMYNYIQLDLIPYGKAETFEKDGTYEFKCQHSNLECEGNKIHACAINEPISERKQLDFVACLFRENNLPQESGRTCAEEVGVNYDSIEICAKGRKGSQLLKEHGERTKAVNPKITFIPTIQLNKSSHVPLEFLLKNLYKEIRKVLDQNNIK